MCIYQEHSLEVDDVEGLAAAASKHLESLKQITAEIVFRETPKNQEWRTLDLFILHTAYF